ncbi:MAG: amidohydrolase family protein [Myxococcota bacterium]
MHPAQVYSDHVLRLGSDGTTARIVGARLDLKGGEITKVTELGRPEFEASASAAGALDLGGTLLTPAFVNAHTHLSMCVFRGLGGDEARRGNVVEDLWFQVEGAQTPEDVKAFARMGALECLLAGQGAVYDHYYHSAHVAQALIETGLEGVVAETLQDLGGPFKDRWESSLQATQSLLENSSLSESGIGVVLGPHATDTVSDALWQRIRDVAARHDVGVHLHVAQSGEEVSRAVAAGHRSPTARLFADGRLEGLRRVWMAHGLHVDAADRALVRPDTDTLVHCPLSQTQFAFPADIVAWRRAGVPIALGTDAGACNDGMDVQRELVLLAHGAAYSSTFATDLSVVEREAHRSAAVREREPWVSPLAALDAVWGAAGRLCPQLPLGRLDAGYRGSICAWNLDHPAFWPSDDPLRALAFGAPSGALHTLIVGGRIIGQVGQVRAALNTDDAKEWRREATERRSALLRRIGHA